MFGLRVVVEERSFIQWTYYCIQYTEVEMALSLSLNANVSNWPLAVLQLKKQHSIKRYV